MNGLRAKERVVPALVILGIALMILVVVSGLFRGGESTEPAPEAPFEASETGPLPFEAAPEAQTPGVRVERPEIHVTRREVPGLTIKQIRAADLSLHEAMFYTPVGDGKVLCGLCPARCLLGNGERGQCRVRINLDGKLYTLVYGRLVAVHDDPIEKKPLYHFMPGTRAFSIATAGCNLGCVFCQNWQISQASPESARHIKASPESVVAAAKRAGCDSIAYTYTEPTVFYEFMLDTAKLAKKEGIRNVWVTCGYINPEPLRELCKVMDAANIDLKGFTEEYYATYCKASLAPVKETIRIAREEGVWVEVTNLVVPGANDDPETIRAMCRWLTETVGPDVPLHFSRFFPNYRMLDKPPTPAATLAEAARIARAEGLHYVYIGNLATRTGDDTFCPQCGHAVIERRGYEITSKEIVSGVCPACKTPIAGVWGEGRE